MTNSFWHTLFWNSDGQRLRPLWRLVIQMLMLGGILLFEIFAFSLAKPHRPISTTDLLIISTLFELIAFTGSVVWARRFLDKKPFVDLGLRWDATNLGDIARGIMVAFMIMGGVFLAMLKLGWLQVTNLDETNRVVMDWQVLGQMGLYLLLFIVIGFQEELLCRGYLLQTIASGWNVLIGVIGSSWIFALLHLGNPGSNWMGFLGIFAAGLLLAFAYVRTRRLWLSIGLHIGWNFFEGVVFGFPTSGVTIYSLTRIHVTGPALWTGGAFGPEAGLIILPALAIGAGLVWLYTK